MIEPVSQPRKDESAPRPPSAADGLAGCRTGADFEAAKRFLDCVAAGVIKISKDDRLEYVNEFGYVKSYVRLVRRKIEENPRLPRYLVSRRGLGYTLVSRPATTG